MKRKNQNRFSFNIYERRGILLLCFLFIVTSCIYFLLPQIIQNDSSETKSLDDLFTQLEVKQQVKEKIAQKKLLVPKSKKALKPFKKNKQYPKKKKYSFPAIKPFNFDPNKISESDLSKMKLAPYIVKTISKYRNKGGVFKKKEDLKKIYGITDSIYTIIEPYIQIQEQTVYQPRETLSTISFIELNSATAEDLESLNGIGPVLSKRIVKFRDKLGGFHSVYQLKQVYGLQDSIFQRIESQLSTSGQLSKININEASVKELGSHPLIEFKWAKVIVNFRKQHGNYSDINELSEIKIIKEADLEKIKPYLGI